MSSNSLMGETLIALGNPQTQSWEEHAIGQPQNPDYWATVKGDWPTRLLHIPTLTSVQRTGTDQYGDVSAPDYGILTYTWGRFEGKPGSAALPIQGVDWSVPPIEPEHFSVEQFLRVIRKIGQDVDYLWLDIACIHQQDRAQQMLEIGRQAAIFSKAKKAYAWLTTISGSQLQNIADKILNEELTSVGSVQLLRDTRQDIDLLSDLESALNTLFRDPWFSSLWTLQEAMLRRDAQFISSDGDYAQITWYPDLKIQTKVLSNACRNIWQDINRTACISRPDLRRLIGRISDMLLRTGYNICFLNNPNVAYSLAQYRTTMRPLDRIYGIMQVYGFRLGEARAPSKSFTIDDLQLELALDLVRVSFVKSQAFVHTKLPVNGRSWCISQHCRVPSPYHSIVACDDECRVSLTTRGTLLIQSRTCAFQQLSRYTQTFRVCVDLDPIPHLSQATTKSQWKDSLWVEGFNESVYNDVQSCRMLAETYDPSQVRLLRLGRLLDSVNSDQYPHLIIYRESAESVWQRIGLCLLILRPSCLTSLKHQVETLLDWEEFEGELT